MKNCIKCGKEFGGFGKTGMCKPCVMTGKKRPDMVGNKLREGLSSWNKGLKTGPQTISTIEKKRRSMIAKKHLLKTMFAKGQKAWNKGVPATWAIGEKNPNWKGGSTKKNALARRSPEVKAWRIAVLARDKCICVLCGAKDSFHADHIKSFAAYPELRTELSNGRTLCEKCHKSTANHLNSRSHGV